MIKHPTLYKKTSTGAIQEWTIAVRGHPDWYPALAIYTYFGQVGGKLQETFELIKEGKNIGKKNETSPEQQGIAEATARWEGKKKKGYVESIEAAQADELDELIVGGILPMLAQSFSKHASKIKYPCWIQPKLDGIRCIAILKDGKCTLWSRTRKQITSMPHIITEIERVFIDDIVLDGELYSHQYREKFEHIVSMVRQEEPDLKHTDVKYHIYDLINKDRFETRLKKLSNIFELNKFVYLFPVQSALVDEIGVVSVFDFHKNNGYEGAMLRNADGMYINKRSMDLQKVKEFEDAEFSIVGIEEGRGKLSGHVGAFVCRTQNGAEFSVKMSGDTSRLKDYFTTHSLWKGKLLTVQYQGLTGTNKVPRFPVGKVIRDYE